MSGMNPEKRYNIPNVRGNQKAIRVKRSLTDSQHYYTKINLEAAQVALSLLPGNAFKLWFWFCTNKDNYEFGLSGVDTCKELNINRSTYNNAVEILIEEGYLRPALLYPKFKGWVFIENGPMAPPTLEELNLKTFEINEGAKENTPAPAQGL